LRELDLEVAAGERLGDQVRLVLGFELVAEILDVPLNRAGAMPNSCAHCFDDIPRAMHCKTSRSRSDKVTKSSCCLGKFTIHSVVRANSLPPS